MPGGRPASENVCSLIFLEEAGITPSVQALWCSVSDTALLVRHRTVNSKKHPPTVHAGACLEEEVHDTLTAVLPALKTTTAQLVGLGLFDGTLTTRCRMELSTLLFIEQLRFYFLVDVGVAFETITCALAVQPPLQAP
jgi:hypothetical protein